jgi:hypothetical protein
MAEDKFLTIDQARAALGTAPRRATDDRRMTLEARLLDAIALHGGAVLRAGPEVERLVEELADAAEDVLDRDWPGHYAGGHVAPDPERMLDEMTGPET